LWGEPFLVGRAHFCGGGPFVGEAQEKQTNKPNKQTNKQTNKQKNKKPNTFFFFEAKDAVCNQE
jgi:hypothetical protein